MKVLIIMHLWLIEYRNILCLLSAILSLCIGLQKPRSKVIEVTNLGLLYTYLGYCTKPIALTMKCMIITDAAYGISTLHASDIVYNNLKSSNTLLFLLD